MNKNFILLFVVVIFLSLGSFVPAAGLGELCGFLISCDPPLDCSHLLQGTCIDPLAPPPPPPNDGFGVTLPNPLCLSGGEKCVPSNILTREECDDGKWKTFRNVPDASLDACCSRLLSKAPACIKDFPSFLAKIGGYITTIIGSLAVVIFLWAGFLFVTSAGNPGQIDKAKKAALYAVIGIAIALAGKGLLEVIKAVLDIK